MNNYKWDLAFACSCEYINKELSQNYDKYIQNFNYEDSSIKVTGEFGPWEIVAGGSPTLLNLKTPIKSGQVYINELKKNFAIDGAVPLIQLQLSFVDADDNSYKQLKFNCKVVGEMANDLTDGAVTVINADTTDTLKKNDPSGLAAALLQTALAKSLIENQEQLTFVFASVLGVPNNNEWLSVKKMIYVYQQYIDNTLGNLAILGMLSDCDISSQSNVFDENLLRQGDDSGFVLSGEKFLQNIIMPKLPNSYKGSNINQFKMSEGCIFNNGDINLNKVKVGAIWYPPIINTLKIYIDNQYIRTHAEGKCNITGLAEAYITFSIDSKNEAVFQLDGPGITFLDDKNKVVSTSKHIPWWEEALGALTLGIMNTVIEIVSECIENSISNVISNTGISGQELGAFVVKWQNQEDISFDDGGLVDNFYMRGNEK